MKLLDLFCCAGGAATGYARAGFEVTGIDINPQPRYPFQFQQADVMSLSVKFLRMFDAIHASPPCQGYSAMRTMPNAKETPMLIDQIRALLERCGRPYIIENVEQAGWAMKSPVLLCGTMFGLGTEGCELRRHRLFEANFPLVAPRCQHTGSPVVGVYGGHARRRSAKHGGRSTRDIWSAGHRVAMSEALGGMPWATCAELSEAIPPAYTEFIGAQLMEYIRGKARTGGRKV